MLHAININFQVSTHKFSILILVLSNYHINALSFFSISNLNAQEFLSFHGFLSLKYKSIVKDDSIPDLIHLFYYRKLTLVILIIYLSQLVLTHVFILFDEYFQVFFHFDTLHYLFSIKSQNNYFLYLPEILSLNFLLLII